MEEEVGVCWLVRTAFWDRGMGNGGFMVSLRNMAEVRPVRQPWSRWVAHQSSSSFSFSLLLLLLLSPLVEVAVEEGGAEGK